MVERYQARSQPATPDVSARADFGAVGTVIRAGTEIAGDIKRGVDKRIQERESALEHASLNKARLELDKQGTELELQMQQQAGPAGDGYYKSIQEKRSELKEQIWSTLPQRVQESATAKAQWDTTWTNSEIASNRRAIAWQQDQEHTFTLSGIQDVQNAATARIEDDPGLAPSILEELKTNILQSGAILTDEEVSDLTEATDQAVTLSTVRGLVKQERFDEADKLLTGIAGNIGDEQRRALEGIVETGRRELQQAKSKQDAQIAKEQTINSNLLEIGILDGNKGRSDINKAVEDGTISVNQAPPLIRTFREQERRRAKAAQANAQIAIGGIPYDPYSKDNKDIADDIWAQAGGVNSLRAVEEREGGVVVSRGVATLTNTASQIGVIPPKAASELQGMAINGSTEEKQLAFDTINYMYEENSSIASAAFATGDKRVMQDAISYTHKVRSGMNPNEAIEAVTLENEAPSDPILKQRKRDGFKGSSDLSTSDLEEALDDKPGLFGMFAGKGVFREGSEEAIMSMYRQNYQDAYLRHGDDKLAKEQAREVTRRVVGRTLVGGRDEFMAYPPERFYPAALSQNQPDWMRDQLSEGVAGIMGADIDPKDIRLISDAVTADVANKGGIPSYVVLYKGEPMAQRFVFDPSKAILKHNETMEIEAVKKKHSEQLQLARSKEQHSLNKLAKELGAGPTTTREQRQQISKSMELEASEFAKIRASAEREADALRAQGIFEIQNRYAEGVE